MYAFRGDNVEDTCFSIFCFEFFFFVFSFDFGNCGRYFTCLVSVAYVFDDLLVLSAFGFLLRNGGSGLTRARARVQLAWFILEPTWSQHQA
jgi:hypothetical protein